jgi:hypothetical protein
MAAHSAPRRPSRYSRHASRRRWTAYHRFGLRDDRARLPDGRRDVYGEAYEEGECDRRSTDQSETASGHASLPKLVLQKHPVRFRTRTLIWINRGVELAKASIKIRPAVENGVVT